MPNNSESVSRCHFDAANTVTIKEVIIYVMARLRHYIYYKSMPRRTEWTHRIDAALKELGSLPCPTVDRRTVEHVLGVSPRQALRILERLGAYSAGQALLIDRLELIDKLERMGQGEEVVFEQRRRERVEEHLAAFRKEQAARKRRIAVVEPRRARLPEGVELFAGRLEIGFVSPEDLLAKLYGLAQAIAADYEAFEAQAAKDGTVM